MRDRLRGGASAPSPVYTESTSYSGSTEPRRSVGAYTGANLTDEEADGHGTLRLRPPPDRVFRGAAAALRSAGYEIESSRPQRWTLTTRLRSIGTRLFSTCSRTRSSHPPLRAPGGEA